MASFFLPGPSDDEHYVRLRDDDYPLVAAGRRFVEEMWATAAVYLDSDVREKAQRAYLPAFWELYLAYTLLLHGIKLVPRIRRVPAQQGPDLLSDEPLVWIEATTPNAGEGPDAVPQEPRTGVAWGVPDEKLKLRLRNSIEEKHRKFLAYQERGFITASHPTVIAISGAALPWRPAELTVPRICRVVFPIGDEQVTVNVETAEVVGRRFAYTPFVLKVAGARVPTDIFLDPAYARVSALIYCASDEINRPALPGGDFLLVHNPCASVGVQRGWLPFAREYWAQGDALHMRDAEGGA